MKTAGCVLIILLVMTAGALPSSAQVSPLHGKITGVDGKPLAGATIVMISNDTGRSFTAKTDERGEFVLVNVPDGLYHVTISKDGKVLYEAHGKRVQEEKDLEIALAKEQALAKEREMQTLTPEQRQKIAEQQQAAEKERENIASINDLLARAKMASDAGNLDIAASSIKQAIQIDSSKDLLWSRLGETYLSAARKASAAANPEAASEDYSQAAEAYRKAISIKPSAAGYHNNLGQALGKLGKTDEAITEYTAAAQLDPTNAGTYYFNLGAILTNTGKIEEANTAFDRAIAADPGHSEAYYWKGVNLLGKATLGKGGKMVAPPGTAEAFKKYLELEPTGRYASAAKEMLATIGEKFETTFTKGKGK
jgi:tetratricopeptide (TPR) repeat protein